MSFVLAKEKNIKLKVRERMRKEPLHQGTSGKNPKIVAFDTISLHDVMSVFLHVHRIYVFTSNCSNYHMSTRDFRFWVFLHSLWLHSFQMWFAALFSWVVCAGRGIVAKYILFTCRFNDELSWFFIIIVAFSTMLVVLFHKTLRYVSVYARVCVWFKPTGNAFSLPEEKPPSSGW